MTQRKFRQALPLVGLRSLEKTSDAAAKILQVEPRGEPWGSGADLVHRMPPVVESLTVRRAGCDPPSGLDLVFHSKCV